nr:ethanolamine utilization protein [Luteimonas saliphila]
MPFASAEGLHGLFSSRAAALQALRTIADDNRLCYGLVGLERLAAGRPCFRAALDRCAGACCGREALAEHALRLEAALQALRVAPWPYAGAIGLVEAGADMTQIHVVRDWHYLGSATGRAAARRLAVPVEGFDHDGYRILMEPVASGRHRIILF